MRMDEKVPAAVRYTKIITREIEAGKFGEPGKRFCATRALAAEYGCSLVTAQKVMVALREAGLISLVGKKYYLTHGCVGRRTPYARAQGSAKKLIGFHVTNIESPFFAALVQEAERCARSRGYQLVTASSKYSAEEEQGILRMFREIGVAGVLSCPGVEAATAAMYKNYILPYVFLCRRPEGLQGDSVLVDNYSAGKNVARHFCKSGYRNFAYIGLEALKKGEDTRFAGFREGIVSGGFELPESHVLWIDAAQADVVRRTAERFLRTQTESVAIFCFHDLLAVELWRACIKLNRAVPEDVAICGFDNLTVSEVTAKPLTTVGYPLRTMAETAVSLLVRRIEGSEEPMADCAITPSLLVRESTRKDAEKPAGTLWDYDILYKI